MSGSKKLPFSFTTSSSGVPSSPYVYMQWNGLDHTLTKAGKSFASNVFHVLALCRNEDSMILYAFQDSKPLELIWGDFQFEMTSQSQNRLEAVNYDSDVTHLFLVKSPSESWTTFTKCIKSMTIDDAKRSQLPLIEDIKPQIQKLIAVSSKSSFTPSKPKPPPARGMVGSGSARGQMMVRSAVVGSTPSSVKMKHAVNYADTTSSPPRKSNSHAVGYDEYDHSSFPAIATDGARESLRRQIRDEEQQKLQAERKRQLQQKYNQDAEDRSRIQNLTNSPTSNLWSQKNYGKTLAASASSTFSGGRYSGNTYSKPGSRITTFFNRTSTSSSLPSSFSATYRSSAGGFKNVGNSCYINAVLQTLLGIPCFQQSLEDDRLTSARHSLNRELAADSVYRTLLNMSLQKNKASPLASNESTGAIDTRTIKDVLGQRNKLFSGYSQQDAHEFFNECLNFLHSDVRDALLTDEEFAQEQRAKEKWEKKVQAAVSKVEHRYDSVFDQDENENENLNREADEEEKSNLKTANGTDANVSVSTTAGTRQLTAKEVADAAFSGLSGRLNTDAAADGSMDDVQWANDESAIIPATPSDDSSPSDADADQSMDHENDQHLEVNTNANTKVHDRHHELDQLLEKLSPVSINFQCIVTCSLTCVSCGDARNVLEEFHDFSVDMPAKQSTSIINAIPATTTKSISNSVPSPAAAAAAAQPSSSSSVIVRAPLASLSSTSNSKSNSDRPSTETNFIFVDPEPPRKSAETDQEVEVDLTLPSPPTTPNPLESKNTFKNSNAFTHMAAAAKVTFTPIHLTKLVQQFFQPIDISYKCKCGGTELTRSPKIKLLPRVLVLHLKRFQYNDFTRSFQKRKDNITFDPIIDMTPFVADEVELPILTAQEKKRLSTRSSNLLQQQLDEAKSPTANRKRKSEGLPTLSPSSVSPSSTSSNKLVKLDVSDLEKRESQRYDDEHEQAMKKHISTCEAKVHDGCVALGEALSKVESDHELRLADIRSKAKQAPKQQQNRQTVRSIAELDDEDDDENGKGKAAASNRDDDDDDDDDEMRRAIAESKRSSLQSELKGMDMTEDEQLEAAIQASMQEQSPAAAPVTISNTSGMQHTYKLISVIIHKGETASSGHYVSQILEETKSSPIVNGTSSNNNAFPKSSTSSPVVGSKPSSQSPKTSSLPIPNITTRQVWKEYDDAYVRNLSDQSAKQAIEKEGYIFFYVYQPTVSTKSPSSKRN